MQPDTSIFLVGPMGSGKSAVGRRLARELGREFIDSDHLIEARSGVDIPFIFEREGEAGFRERECRLIDEVTQRPGIVLATGGGSNIANMGLILGITAIISPPNVQGGLMRRELPAVMLSAAALPLLLRDGVIGRLDGALLLLGAAWFTRIALRAVTPKDAPRHSESAPPPQQGRLALMGFVVVGLAVLLGGGKLFVDGAVGIALRVGMSERVVGLTVVAIGTSLPELAASLVAALRGHSELAVGNVLGSNIFNVLLILGVTALAHPVEGSLRGVGLDLIFMGVLTVLTVIAMHTERRIRRYEGAGLVIVYSVFLLALAVTR